MRNLSNPVVEQNRAADQVFRDKMNLVRFVVYNDNTTRINGKRRNSGIG